MNTVIGTDYGPPVATSEHDPSPLTPHGATTANAATATTVTLLAAPAAGFVWEIVQFGIWQSAASTATQLSIIKGATSGTPYLTLAILTGGNGQAYSNPAKCYLSEGLQFQNGGTGQTSTGQVIARQIASGTF